MYNFIFDFWVILFFSSVLLPISATLQIASLASDCSKESSSFWRRLWWGDKRLIRYLDVIVSSKLTQKADLG